MEGHLFKDASTHHRFLIAALQYAVQHFIRTDGATCGVAHAGLDVQLAEGNALSINPVHQNLSRY